MPTTFSADHLRKLLRVNSYPFAETAHILFGIRGASAASSKCEEFRDAHLIEQTDVNYQAARCLIGIWNPVQNKIALFPGSTVPHLKYIKRNVEGKAKSNCMMSGYYSHYEKGFHNPNPGHAHQALRLATNIMYRRSFNDFTFSNADPVEVGNPNDNLHAAYSDTGAAYSSAGCQVVVGQPRCRDRGAAGNTGPWKRFFDIIYRDTPQQRFAYALFRYADAAAVAAGGGGLMEARLRFGSQGSAVLALQTALEKEGSFFTNKDGAFGKNTLQAVLAYQTKQFGAQEADGVVGHGTATALGLTLPMI